MPFCEFCSKQCATTPSLKRHIDSTLDCKKASHEEFRHYANTIWDNIPENPNHKEPQALPNIPIHPDLPDFYLEEDIQLAEEALHGEENDILPIPPPPLHGKHQLHPQHVTVEDVPDNEDGGCYIENFLEENMASVTWGQSKPLFECIDDDQKRGGGPCWGPFEDEDEWQLAEWLIRNVSQRQTDNFLRLPIIRILSSIIFVNISLIDSPKNIHNPPMGVIRDS